MENITLGQIATWVALLAGLITGTSVIVNRLKKWISDLLTEKFNAIDVRLDDMSSRIEDVDMNNCKNFLVSCIGDMEAGRMIDSTELQHFWEQYDFYVSHGGNSYIREKVNKLKDRELL